MKYNYPIACEYLGRVRDADRHVEWLQERVANMRMLLTDTSVHLTDMPHSDSPDQQKNLTLLAEIDEMEREIIAAEASAKETRLEVGLTVCRLSDPVIQRVLLLYYLEKKSWRDVAGEMNYSPAQTYRYRDEGYAELEEILKTA